MMDSKGFLIKNCVLVAYKGFDAMPPFPEGIHIIGAKPCKRIKE